jgi:hypothetical protein
MAKDDNRASSGLKEGVRSGGQLRMGNAVYIVRRPLAQICAIIPSRVTASHPNSEVKLDRDQVVLASGRGWEG